MLVINISHPLIENIYQLSKGSIIQAGGESSNVEVPIGTLKNIWRQAQIEED